VAKGEALMVKLKELDPTNKNIIQYEEQKAKIEAKAAEEAAKKAGKVTTPAGTKTPATPGAKTPTATPAKTTTTKKK
jgi:hypothetical protein